MQSVVQSATTGIDLLPAVLGSVLLLGPLSMGALVGYRTVGRTSDRLRAGMRAGLALTALATAGMGGYVVIVLRGTSGYDASTLLSLLPTVLVAWLLLAGVYSVCVAVIGSLVGGYLRRRRSAYSAV